MALVGRADGKTAEVLGNVEAMQRAISLAEPPAAFEVEDILEIHRTLLCGLAAVGFARHIEGRQQDWLERLGQPRGEAAVRQLVDAGILRPLNERRWGRVWECDELLALVDEFERSLAAPPSLT